MAWDRSTRTSPINNPIRLHRTEMELATVKLLGLFTAKVLDMDKDLELATATARTTRLLPSLLTEYEQGAEKGQFRSANQSIALDVASSYFSSNDFFSRVTISGCRSLRSLVSPMSSVKLYSSKSVNLASLINE